MNEVALLLRVPEELRSRVNELVAQADTTQNEFLGTIIAERCDYLDGWNDWLEQRAERSRIRREKLNRRMSETRSGITNNQWEENEWEKP